MEKIISSRRTSAIVLIVGCLSPVWLFLLNFSLHVVSHKASLAVEVLAITEKGQELSNLCRISPKGKIDSFYVVKPNYFSREDEWGQGKGYIRTIGFRAAELSKIKVLLMRCGERYCVWNNTQIQSEWKRDGENYLLENLDTEDMPFYGAVMNYAGNASVARAVLLPSLLMSLILIALSLAYYSLYRNYRPDLSTSQNIYHGLFQTHIGRLFSWTCITSIVIFYLYNYFTLPPYIHAETYLTFPQLVNSENEGFWSNMATKSFDLGRVEEGGYRPRALAFLIGYTDTNLMAWLNHHFSWWGPRLPFMILAAFLLAVAVYKLTRTLIPSIPVELALIIGCSMLFFQNFQTTGYLYLRSAKALCPGVCVFMLHFYFKYRERSLSLVQTILFVLALFILTTLDEQVLSVAVLIVLLSIIFNRHRTRSKSILYACLFAVVLYMAYHQTAGVFLFDSFTPGGIHKHDHTFLDPFLSFGLEVVERAGEIWLHLALSLGSSLIILIPVVVVTASQWMKLTKDDKLMSSVLILFSFVMVGAVIGSHRTAYYSKELWNGAYFLPAACVMLAAVLFTWGKTIQKNDVPRAAILLTAVFLVGTLINTLRVDIFYNNYTSVEARERGAIVDPNDWMSPENAKYFKDARKPALRLEKFLKN